MNKSHCITDEAFAEEILNIPPVADRSRLVGLDRTGLMARAKERSLRRELATKTAKLGSESPQVRALEERLRLQQAFRAQIQAETQRSEVVPPERRADAFILHGRVVDRHRIGQPDLTVSAIDRDGQVETFACTDARGSFTLTVPADENRGGRQVFLQVSNRDRSILYRGTKGHSVVAGQVVYREIVLGEQEERKPCPPPPEPEPETVQVPDITGQSEADATSHLQAARLSIGERQTRPDPNRIGLVIAQKPKAGAEVPIHTAIDLVIGVDRPRKIPKITGLKVRSARRKLAGSGLSVGRVTEQPGEREGVVLKQSPEAGEEASPNTTVHMVIGRKPNER